MLLVNIGWASENPASLFVVKMTEFWACASIRRVRSRAKKPRRVTTAPINMSSGLDIRNRRIAEYSDFSCPVFGGRGVQNLDQGGAFAPPFCYADKPCSVRLPRHTRLTIGRGVQGGASLNGYRGCIVRLYQN